MSVQLSTIKPDYEDLLAQLQASLKNEESWKDLIEASTGQLLTKFVAGIGAYSQFTIERAIQENFLGSAQGQASVSLAVKDLGVRIQRKQPSKVKADLQRKNFIGVFSIPKYTQFKIEDLFFFNPEPITFNAGQEFATNIELEEGKLEEHQFFSNGSSYQKFFVGSNYSSSNTRSMVKVNGEEWYKVNGGVWLLPAGDKCYSDNTSILGELEITLGSNVAGVIPTANSSIVITNFIVTGLSSNKAVSGLSVALPSNTEITGLTTTGITGGDNEKSIEFYKEIGSQLGRSLGRTVTKSDYEATIKTYPSVIDSRCVGERDINPGDQNWQSTVGIYLITRHVWSNEEEDNFIGWVESKGIAGVKCVLEPVTPITSDITASVLIDPVYTSETLQQIQSNIVSAINSIYGLEGQRLGRDVYISDIYDLIMSIPGVKHVPTITSPSMNYLISNDQYFKINNINLTVSYV